MKEHTKPIFLKNYIFYATQGGSRFIEAEAYDCFQDHHVKANIGIENLYTLLNCEITMPYVNTRYPLGHNCFFTCKCNSMVPVMKRVRTSCRQQLAKNILI